VVKNNYIIIKIQAACWGEGDNKWSLA